MADTEMSSCTDGPVLNLMNKRLRALRKKHNRIVQMEEAVSQGKPLNKEQEEVLRSKTAVLALIDEYEKLRQPLQTAVQEEILMSQSHPDHHHQQEKPVTEEVEETQKPNPNSQEPVIEDLLNLIYFASLFDAKPQSDFTSTMLTRTHERGCCLTYDYVTDDATDLLVERDLDLISDLGGLVISRPTHSGVSHKKALSTCLQHAKLWLMNSEEPIPGTDVTYAGLRERLNKIMASDYYTTTPEMKAPVEVAAAAGKFVPCQISVFESSVPSETGNAFQHYQQQDEETTNFQGQETGSDQSSPVEVHHEEELEMPNAAGVVLVQQQDLKLDAEAEEQSQRDVESNEETTNQRKPYSNHRGGGYGGRRGGYPNGRGGRTSRGGGGGGYQNGRSQYYEQPGNYYPRNYNTRGGRSSRGGSGGYSLNSHGSTAYGSHAQADSPSS